MRVVWWVVVGGSVAWASDAVATQGTEQAICALGRMVEVMPTVGPQGEPITAFQGYFIEQEPTRDANGAFEAPNYPSVLICAKPPR